MNTITNNRPIKFLQEKIQGIRSALFFTPANNILEVPTSIITVLRVDNEGYIWFFTKRPSHCNSAFEGAFPARLDFFRKKRDYFLQIKGKAFMVNVNDISMEEWADVSTQVKESALNELMLMKIKMTTADYFEEAPAENTHWWNSFAQKIHQWIFNHKLGYKPYGLTPKNFMKQG